MLIEWIRREPVAFADFFKAMVAVILMYAVQYGMRVDAAAAITTAAILGLTWFTRAAVVPNIKLPQETVDTARTMTSADIKDVRASGSSDGGNP